MLPSPCLSGVAFYPTYSVCMNSLLAELKEERFFAQAYADDGRIVLIGPVTGRWRAGSWKIGTALLAFPCPISCT